MYDLVQIAQDLFLLVWHLVLDLDETLVCAYETSSLPVILRSQATEVGLSWFELECVSSDKEYDGKPKVNHVTVFERPGLRNFLKETSEFADLVLFTAGLEGVLQAIFSSLKSPITKDMRPILPPQEGNIVAYKAAKLAASLGVNHSFVYSDKPPWQQKLPTVEAGNATEVACDNVVLSIMPQPMAESQ
ncbi:hypothetical protein IFM89_035133, partial [Coptis chinensis]